MFFKTFCPKNSIIVMLLNTLRISDKRKSYFRSDNEKLLVHIVFSAVFHPEKADAQLVINDLPGNLRRCIVVNGDTIILARMRSVVCYPKRFSKTKKKKRFTGVMYAM